MQTQPISVVQGNTLLVMTENSKGKKTKKKEEGGGEKKGEFASFLF